MAKNSWHLAVCAGLWLASQGCATYDSHSPGSDESIEVVGERSALSLRAVEQSDDEVVLEVAYVRGANTPGPRVLELKLKIGDALKLVKADAGNALTLADKDLVAQERESGVLRLVAYASGNVTSIESGVLARVRMKRADTGSTRVELLTEGPMFAPAEAQDGLLVGEAIDL